MATQTVAPRPWVRFTVHFAEMLVAMVAGMLALGPLWELAFPELSTNITAHAMVMATDMTVGMVAVMAWRKHSARSMADMGLAMYLSFLVFLVPYWAGAVSAMAVMVGGHVVMVPAMLGAMLLRKHEYLHHQHG